MAQFMSAVRFCATHGIPRVVIDVCPCGSRGLHKMGAERRQSKDRTSGKARQGAV